MEKNAEKIIPKNIFLENIKIIIGGQPQRTIIDFMLPLIISYLILLLSTYVDTNWNGGEFQKNLVKYQHSENVIYFGIFYLTAQVFVYFLRKTEKKIKNIVIDTNKKVDDNTDLIEKHLRSSKIVFEASIAEYDHKHLLAMQRILNKLSDEVDNVFAIDNSDPTLWWSDSMTGYLGLLAKWKSHDTEKKRRNVSRIFVYSDNEILSPVLAKTLTLHSMIGFRTYIFSEKIFSKIFDEIKDKGSCVIEKREILVWNNSKENKISFELDNIHWLNVNSYQSFWLISSNKNERYKNQKNECFVWKNYYGEAITSQEINKHVWFEFISCENKMGEGETVKRKKEYWERIPDEYMDLIKELIKKTYCCKNVNEVKQLNGMNEFGLEIKTNLCNGCVQDIKNCMNKNNTSNEEKFEFTSEQDIKEMLIEYYNIINK
jgi:hypothetical protein